MWIPFMVNRKLPYIDNLQLTFTGFNIYIEISIIQILVLQHQNFENM